MTSYKVYQILDFWLPSIGVGLIFTSIFSLTVCKIGWKFYHGKTKLVPRWFFEVLRLAFRDLRRNEKDQNIIYNLLIGRVSFAVTTIITVPVVFSTCFITFWNMYMVEEQIGEGCDPNYDCFPVLNKKLLQTTPVTNCTQDWPPDTVFQCYQLLYNYARGVSAAGGIIFFASIIFKLFTATLLAPHNIENVCLKWFFYALGMMGGVMVVLIFIILHTAFSFREVVFRTVTYQIQFALYSMTLIVVFMVVGPLLVFGIEYEAPRGNKNNNLLNPV